MLSKNRIYPPVNWTDFEELCLKLWGQLWQIPNEIDYNSTNSQGQNGVDIYGMPKGENVYYGIQCKNFKKFKKDGKLNSLTISEIDKEIQLAESFKPTLKKYIIATTLEKDKVLEEYIRTINIERLNDNKFGIQICFWDYISEKIFDNRIVLDWYLRNQDFTSDRQVSVLFNFKGGVDTLVHNPLYTKVICNYRLENEKDIEHEKKIIMPSYAEILKDSSLELPFYVKMFLFLFNLKKKKKISDSIFKNKIYINGVDINSEEYKKSLYPKKVCKNEKNMKLSFNSIADDKCPLFFEIILDNIGSGVIEDYKIRIFFDGDFEDIEVKTPRLSEIKSYKRNVYINSNSCLIQPERNFLVQKDYFISEEIKLVPIKGKQSEIFLNWEFISRDYNDQGKLKILINPNYEISHEEYLVLDEKDCKVHEEIRYKTYEYTPVINF